MDFKILKYIFIVIFISSCGAKKNLDNNKIIEKTPDWINNYKKNYPNIRYISFLAISDIKSIADKQAMLGIITQFQVDIKSKIYSQEKVTETSNSFNKEYSANEDTQIVSEQELKNIKISETYHDENNNKFYVLATLDKMETSQIYITELSKLESDFKSYYNNFEKENNIIEKYKMVNKCIDLENQMKIVNYKLDVLGGVNKKTDKNNYDNLILNRRKLANHITFSISNENEKIYLSLKNSITNLGFKIAPNNAKLKIKYIYNINESSIKNKDVIFVAWDFTINVIENENILFSYKKSGRSSQKTLNSAIERTYYDIDRDIVEKFSEYLNKNL